MDPVACVLRIADAIASGDKPEAMDAVLDLKVWVTTGGFRPYDWTPEETADFIRRTEAKVAS